MPADPEWEKLYQQALLELNDSKLSELILKAEQAARKRLAEIQSNGRSSIQFEERHKLQDALSSLECLRRITPEKTK